MTEHGLPALHALLIWWLSTGLILFLDGLPRSTFRWSMAGATLVLGLSLWGLATCADNVGIEGAYWGFTLGLLVWGWLEISFYTGMVTGPRRHACPTGCSGRKHFGHALQASLHHEIAIVVCGMAVAAATWGGANRLGLWTYIVLAVMHESARLNVFLGVPNVTEEFLPPHLAYLRSFIAKRAMNPLFPVSVTAGTIVATVFGIAAFAPGASDFDEASAAFLCVLTLIALAEHWFLVLPLNFGALWAWSLKWRAAERPPALEVITGFRGVGCPREPKGDGPRQAVPKAAESGARA